MLCDLHVHSRFSVDSQEEMDSICEAAVQKGVGAICITDHIDYCEIDSGLGFYNADGYFAEIARVQGQYPLKILSGAEFSEPHLYPRELEAAQARPYDMLMGSIHYWYFDRTVHQMIRDGVSARASFEHYWHECYLAARTGGFDVFGHFDFPKRYHKVCAPEFDMIGTVLRELVKNGVCLEINTSSIRQNAPGPMPGEDLLTLYKSCGGKYVTLGSDAHLRGDIAADFDWAKRLVEKIGLSEVYFSGRKRIVL